MYNGPRNDRDLLESEVREPERISHILGCAHGGALPARENFGNGYRYFIWCEKCQENVTRKTIGMGGDYMSEPYVLVKFPDIVLERVPLRETSMPRYCEGPCKRFQRCQQHHVYPRGLLPKAQQVLADDWPLFWLCKDCHDLWHSTVTPGLETPYDAQEHVLILSRYLKESQLQKLLAALTHKLNRAVA